MKDKKIIINEAYIENFAETTEFEESGTQQFHITVNIDFFVVNQDGEPVDTKLLAENILKQVKINAQS